MNNEKGDKTGWVLFSFIIGTLLGGALGVLASEKISKESKVRLKETLEKAKDTLWDKIGEFLEELKKKTKKEE